MIGSNQIQVSSIMISTHLQAGIWILPRDWDLVLAFDIQVRHSATGTVALSTPSSLEGGKLRPVLQVALSASQGAAVVHTVAVWHVQLEVAAGQLRLGQAHST